VQLQAFFPSPNVRELCKSITPDRVPEREREYTPGRSAEQRTLRDLARRRLAGVPDTGCPSLEPQKKGRPPIRSGLSRNRGALRARQGPINLLLKLLERLCALNERSVHDERRRGLNAQGFRFAAALVHRGHVLLTVVALVELGLIE